MATLESDNLITIERLISELKKFEERHPDSEVTCCLPDDTLCYSINTRQDEDGKVCLRFEEEEFDRYSYDVDMLLSDLERYDRLSKVYMEACGFFMTFSVSNDGSFLSYEDADDIVTCDGMVIGEYEEEEYNCERLTREEERMLSEKAEKKKCSEKIESAVLGLLTILTACGFVYSGWSVASGSCPSLVEGILWCAACLFLSIVGALTLYYSRH